MDGEVEFQDIGVTSAALLRYYESRCATAVKRGSSLILAIPKGLSPECVAINLELTKQSMLNSEASSFCETVDELFIKSPLQLTPCMDTYKPADEDAMPKLDRAMRHGYARDRVIGINKIKKALLNQSKVGASADFLLKQNETITYLKRWFSKFEQALNDIPEVTKPSSALSLKREQWRRLVDQDPDALQNQITFVQATTLHGTTRVCMEALAMDPTVERSKTLEYAAVDLLKQEDRDRQIGTETFVAFTFPPEEHEMLVAAAAQGGGIAKTENSYAYPAYVTFHSPTGEATTLAVAASGQAPNTLFVGDAAVLMEQVHALASQAKRSCLMLEHS